MAYYRVSTRRQGGSGLGLEAQRRTVAAFCEANGYRVVDSFKDVERGKNDRWPGLKGAIERAKGLGAELLIAKLDRLSRNVEFTMHLRNSGVRFTACDLPEANTITVAVMAALAQQEREMISARTRAALAELSEEKRRRRAEAGARNPTDAARKKAAQVKRQKALAYYNGTLTHAKNYRAAGWSYQRIADTLNESGATARRGGPFTASLVHRLLRMADASGSGRRAPADAVR